MNYKYKLLIQVLILFLPMYMIINGTITSGDFNLIQPDISLQFGLLIMGIISLSNILHFLMKLAILGKSEISTYDNCRLIFYLIWFVPTCFMWLLFVEAIPISAFN